MPQRFLRPGITTSRRFNSVPFIAQSFYLRLLTLVDDFGRYEADARLLRSYVFPFGDDHGKDIPMETVANTCCQLSESGLVLFYKSKEGKEYLQVLRWQERARAEKSKYPSFDNSCEQMFATVVNPQEKDASLALAITSSPSPNGAAHQELLWPKWTTEAFKKEFEEWKSARKSMGKKPKDWEAMFQKQLDWLADYGEMQALAIVSASIRNNWQGLHEPNLRAGDAQKPKTKYIEV